MKAYLPGKSRGGFIYSEEGNQAATFPGGEGGHLVSPERIRNKIRSRRAAKQADFMSTIGNATNSSEIVYKNFTCKSVRLCYSGYRTNEGKR